MKLHIDNRLLCRTWKARKNPFIFVSEAKYAAHSAKVCYTKTTNIAIGFSQLIMNLKLGVSTYKPT